jgi:hypothetical protein
MYANLISLVGQFLTPDVIGKIAQACGISDRTIMQKAVGAAVPALFSGLANLASKPDGARQLADVVASQPPSLLDSLTSASSGAGQLADMGKTALTSLFGRSAVGNIAGALGRYAGLGEGTTTSLLSMLAPVALGVLGREAGAGGASGLAQLLTSQKDSFAAAMPKDVRDLLNTGGMFDTAAAAAAPAASRVNETYRTARDRGVAMAQAVSRPTTESSSRWMYWALPLLALAGLLWYLFSGQRTEPIAEVTPQTKVAQGVAAIGDLQPQVARAIEQLNGTLVSVTDWSSRDVLPKLQQSSSEIDRLTALVNRLPVDARERLADALKTTTGRLKTALDNANASPRLAADAQPVLAALRSKIDTLAMTPGVLAQQRSGVVIDKVVYLSRSPNDAVWISAYFDRPVLNGSGERIGVVHDLVMGPDAKVVAAVVGVGGFLGIGEKEVAVPFSVMQVARRDNEWHLVVDTTRDALKDAPSYETTGDRVRLGRTAADKR